MRSSPDALEPYRVWAPRPSHVVVRVDGDDHAMSRDADGWWTSERRMNDGDVYGYVIDGDGPLPDPRSAHQPFGVHGLSQCVDHARFAWTDAGWRPPPLAAAVIYELHVGTFSAQGTFAGAQTHLPHLVDLGVTHVELMPVAQFSGSRGWGYDGVDLFAPHNAYGEPGDLKRLVDACHAHGLAVLLDVVYNHLGPAGNYLDRFAPYFNPRYHTPWGAAINLDAAGSDHVRRFLCDNALMWLRDYHLDGLRIDAVHALIDTSATHLLEQLADEVEQLSAATGRHLLLIAESDLNDPRIVRRREVGGYGIDAQWSDDFHHALHAVATGERVGYYEDFGTMDHLVAALRQGFVYAGSYSPHRQRVHGRRLGDVPGWRLIVSAQNHDQVGNRALGERLAQLVSLERLKIIAALLLTSPFVPMLFQGEEWGASTPFQYFTTHDDPDLGAQVSTGRRREFAAFGWDPADVPDPQAPATFERSRLRWSEPHQSRHAELLAWHRRLIALRRDFPSLRNGRFHEVGATIDEAQHCLTVQRGDILVACNFSARAARLDVPDPSRLLLASTSGIAMPDRALALPPASVAVLQCAGPIATGDTPTSLGEALTAGRRRSRGATPLTPDASRARCCGSCRTRSGDPSAP